MFLDMSVCQSVILSKGGGVPVLDPATPSLYRTPGPVPSVQGPGSPQDIFKLGHYEARTVKNQAFGIQMNAFL